MPIACLAFTIMVPVNWTNGTLERSSLNYSNIDKLSISNIPIGSRRYDAEFFYETLTWTCMIFLPRMISYSRNCKKSRPFVMV